MSAKFPRGEAGPFLVERTTRELFSSISIMLVEGRYSNYKCGISLSYMYLLRVFLHRKIVFCVCVFQFGRFFKDGRNCVSNVNCLKYTFLSDYILNSSFPNKV